MSTILEQEVTIYLTNVLGRTPTSEEIRLGTIGSFPLSQLHNFVNVAQNVLSIFDTDDIQGAIDKIDDNGGGVVYLNPGTYNVSSDINVPSNVYLVGLVKNLCIIDFGGSSRSIISSGTADITISELTIQNTTDAGLKLINISGTILINNVDFINCAIGIEATDVLGLNIIGGGIITDGCGIGMKLDTCRAFTIDNSSFVNSNTYGLQMIDSNSAIIRNSGFGTNGSDGINGENIDTIAFEALLIDGNGGDGINFDVGCIGNRIFGCRISTNVNGVVIGNSATKCINNIVNGNSITSNSGIGIYIVGSNATNNLISSNILLANGTQADNNGTTTLIRSNVGQADN